MRIIEKYGLPQQWNQGGRYGAERYVEAQVWSEGPIRRYIKLYGR